jgi:hypothetical protein
MKPQLWDAVNGTIRTLNEYTEKDGRISVPIEMQPHQSWFIVFSNIDENFDGGFEKNFPDFKHVQTIKNKWQVNFLNKAIGPELPVQFETLSDWALSANNKIKYYSGTAIYKTSFELDSIPENEELFISLGKVCVMARVKLNDVELGGAWMAPYRLQATEHLKTGKNKIEVEVVNLWRNQLIKDKKLAKKDRYTWNLVDDIAQDEEPHSSGLLGSVTIEAHIH